MLLEVAHTPWHRAMIALLLFAGLCRSEVAAITLGDLDMENASCSCAAKHASEAGRGGEAGGGVQPSGQSGLSQNQ